MKQNNTLVQNIISGLHGDLGEFLMINNGRLILTQKDSMLKQHFEQLNFVLQASLNLYELTEILNLIRFSIQMQSLTNITDIQYFDNSYKNAYITQNAKLTEFFVQKYSKFPTVPNTKGIQMLIFVLENYIRHYHETVNTIIEDIINNYKQLYNGLQTLDYKLIDDSTDPFIGFLTQQLQISDVKHFQFVGFVKDFYEIYLIKIINQPLSLKKEEYQVSEQIMNKQKQLVYDTIKNMSTFSFILNHSQNYKQQLLPSMQLYFHQYIHGHLITKYYKNMVFPYLLQSFINDFQREFFIQSKISVLNSQSQLQNNPFEGFNQIQNYNETLIIKNLFPYFVDEQLAREMVVCARMVLYLRENNINIDVDPAQAFQSDDNLDQCDDRLLRFVTSEFEFHSSFQRYNNAIQAIYIENLQKTDLKLEILKLLFISTFQIFSKQYDEIFDQFGPKLKSVQRFGSDTIEVENEGIEQYGEEIQGTTVIGLGEILRNNQLKLNGVGLKRRLISRNDQNQLIYDINDFFTQTNNPSLLHYQRGIEKVCVKYNNINILDLEVEFYQTEVVREVYNVTWNYSSNNGNKMGLELLINNILLCYPIKNTLILQAPVLGGLSKVFRQLLVLRFIQFNFQQDLEAFRLAEVKLNRFTINGQRKQFHFQNGATSIIRAGNRLCVLKGILMQLYTQMTANIQWELQSVVKSFQKSLNVKSYSMIKAQLATLISDLFLATKLTKMRFYLYVMQMQQAMHQFCLVSENFAKIIHESINEHTGYGMMESSQIKQLHSAIDVLHNQVNELLSVSYKIL